jgi:hypothetical protein
MKITNVSVRYGYLRTYPGFSNKKIEIEYSSELFPGETARDVQLKLFELAQKEVNRLHDDKKDDLDIPF